MAPPHSCLWIPEMGGQVRDHSLSVGPFLTRKQVNYIYKKIETGETISTDAIEQEIKLEEQLNRIDDSDGETNPYCELIVNNAEMLEPLIDTNGTMVNFEQHFKLYTTW